MAATAISKAAEEQGIAILDALIAGYLEPDTKVCMKCHDALYACGDVALGHLKHAAEDGGLAGVQRQRLSSLISRIMCHPPDRKSRGQGVPHALIECLRVNRPQLHEVVYRAISCLPILADHLVSLASAHGSECGYCCRLLRAASLTGGNLSSTAWFDLMHLRGLTADPAVRQEASKLMEAIRRQSSSVK